MYSKKPRKAKVALVQTYAWFVGMAVMSTAMHWAGLLGSPRRTDDVSYFGSTAAQAWMPEMMFAAIGGTILFASIIMFVAVAIGTLFTEKIDHGPVTFAEVEPASQVTPAIFDNMRTWAILAVILAVLAYAGPVRELLAQHVYGAPGMRTW